ncbi:MAG: flagellar biosynthesis protein FlhB [Spirochaetales bacterium]|nr:flagellar biosynthesis protein FlhB [Spirochaetales bacterium]MCF7937598.1 flagellar biosynthesis protein FlhB [Spirochaetales bacterium]
MPPGGVEENAKAGSLFDGMHLQWFAAEDEGRTEEPTEHKIRKAREEGKVAKSSELSSAIVLLLPLVTLGIFAPYLWKTMSEMVTYFMRHATEVDITETNVIVSVFYRYFIRLTFPIAIVAFIAAVVGNLMQVGFLFTVKPITPDLKKIVPKFGKFFKRAFFSGEAAFNLAKSLGKVAVIGVLSFVNIRANIGPITHLVEQPFSVGVQLVGGIAFRIIVEATIVLLVLAIPDYLFQRKQHRESLKMSKQEVKEERKQYEGDPLVKSRLRERMQNMLSQNMLRNVPEADVVITNPTHFAVAVEYDRAVMHAPTVIAKGQDYLAQRIKEIAQESNIPVIENKPLARALHAEVEIGDEIPESYYRVMAIVLSEVYRMNQSSNNTA